MKTILIGTNNPSKLRRIRDLLSGLPVRCVSPAELSLEIDAPETARSAVGNAREKALAWHRASGLPVLAEDSGLRLLDLPEDHPDQPGVHVRRVAGHDMSDEEMIGWYAAIAHRHGGKLRAGWQDAWCFVADESTCETFVDDLLNRSSGWLFLLTDTPCEARHPGWPLDSLSLSLTTGQYKAEMSIADMDQSFQKESRHGEEGLKKLRSWMHRCVNEHLLHETEDPCW